jgi:transglutaminase-like putative cysteine protease
MTRAVRAGRGRWSWLASAAQGLPWIALCAVVATAFGPFFAGPAALVPILGATLVGGALALWVAGAPAALRRPEALLLVPAVAYAVFALLLLFPSQSAHGLPGSRTLVAFGHGLQDGWARMLSIGLPADPSGDLLVLPTLLAWTAAFAAVLLTTRSAVVLAPVVPPLVLYLVALGFTAGRGGSGLWHGLTVTLVGLLAVLVRVTASTTARSIALVPTEHSGGDAPLAHWWRSTRGRLSIGAPLLVAVAGLATAAAAILPVDGTDRVDWRTLRAAPVSVVDTLSPLVQVRSQLEGPRRDVVTVRLSAAGGKIPRSAARLRTAALGDFDGASWRPTGDYRIAGTTLPRGAALTVPAVEARAWVTVKDLAGPFLPALGQPTGVRGTRVAYDADSGTLVAADGGADGRSYELATLVATPTVRELRQAVPLNAPETARYRAVPALPDPAALNALRRVADRRAVGPTQWDRLTALATFLADPKAFPYDISARPGHSVGTVLRMLVTGDKDDRRGYAEQHAAAFSILARLKGFPTRIAVGYLLDPRASSSGDVTVTTAAAHAWPEVDFKGIGWVPFEPTDTRNLGSTRPSGDKPAPGGPQGAADAPEALPQVVLPELDRSGEPAGEIDPALRTGLVAGLVLGGTVPLFSGLVLGEKWRRRRRRRLAGRPAARIAGAWREVRDRLRERGVPTPPSLTPKEVAGRAAPLGEAATAVGRLAQLVTASVFAREEPAEADVHAAWELEAAVRRHLAADVPTRTRVAAALDPRPLVPPALASLRVRWVGQATSESGTATSHGGRRW